MEPTEDHASLSSQTKSELEDSINLSYKAKEIFSSAGLCKGQLFLLESAKAFHPTPELAVSSKVGEPRKQETWNIGLIGKYFFIAPQADSRVSFALPKHVSTDGKTFWSMNQNGFYMKESDFAALGKTVEEPVPNAYARSYSRIVHANRLYIGETEVRNFLQQRMSPKDAGLLYKKACEALRQE